MNVKTVRKGFSLLVALLFVAGSLFLLPGCAVDPDDDGDDVPLTGEVINVYNWGLYMADGSDDSLDLNAEFTRRTGIVVNYVEYESNEVLYTKLKTGGIQVDIIIPSDYMIGKLIEENMLQKLDFSNIPNYSYIDEEFKNTNYDPSNEYSVPYTWGTTGVIYNSKYVTKEVDSWDILWDEDYAGKILMFNNSRDAFAIAQLLLGQDVNTTSQSNLEAAAEKLSEQKGLVQSYVMDQVFAQMEHEEAWIAPYYAGDFLTMKDENDALEFCFPDEGYNLFIDAMCIPNSAQNKSAAEKYINFLTDPEISAANMDYIGYSTPISEAKQYLDEELAANPVAYPDEETLARGVLFENLPTETIRQMNDLFNAVKSSGSGWSWIVIAVVVVVLIVAALLVIRDRKKRQSY